MESDSLASVKLRFQSIKGFFVKREKLFYDGRELARDYLHHELTLDELISSTIEGLEKGNAPIKSSDGPGETLEKESVIEQIIYDAEAIVSQETTEEEFISTVSDIMD
ncbi:hypothetical protein HID58_032039 [Brassica napus]|uniref:Ubiquitin-like domain-containing protein n=1 Tax=Brassica napus TaxID=3708 RepID=A0ABQ8BVC8_BRANA|nr:hypothetical protein HID58_032039 [Brassica napus]